MSTMYKRCKRNCKDKDKDTTERTFFIVSFFRQRHSNPL